MKPALHVGDIVRLTASAERRTHTLLEEERNDWAIVMGIEPLIAEDCYKVSRELAGSCFWCQCDLALVRKAKPGERIVETVTKAFKAKAFVPSNFSIPQQAAVDELDASMDLIESLPKSHNKPQRDAHRRLVEVYKVLRELGIDDCLTPHELETINHKP